MKTIFIVLSFILVCGRASACPEGFHCEFLPVPAWTDDRLELDAVRLLEARGLMASAFAIKINDESQTYMLSQEYACKVVSGSPLDKPLKKALGFGVSVYNYADCLETSEAPYLSQDPEAAYESLALQGTELERKTAAAARKE